MHACLDGPGAHEATTSRPLADEVVEALVVALHEGNVPEEELHGVGVNNAGSEGLGFERACMEGDSWPWLGGGDACSMATAKAVRCLPPW